ncbi:MAG: PQQ-dependent dehydrogenase, methanol/ethanol family, partial [Gammaproteobacteria bacterium]
MKWITILLALLPALGQTAGPTLDELKNDHVLPQNITTYGMGQGAQRWSPLTTINRDNVGNLVPAWSMALETERGQEGQPLVYDGKIYVTTHEATFAIDARTGRKLWRNKLRYSKKMFRMVCCGFINRGAVIFDGKLYRQTLDNRVMAIDMQ